ncbi:MAG: acyltransferase family protein [Janthinobacterium lividum]
MPDSPALTGLRGVAAVLVVMHHASLHLGAVDLPWAGGLLRRGYLGVDLFFVLSGFVMSMVYGSWFTGGALGAAPGRRADVAGSLAVFLVRRAGRVWPLHAAVLAVLVAGLALSGQDVPSLRFTLANLLLVQGWGVSGEINAPAWSVSTEVLAYLLFPLLAGVVLRWRWGAVLGVAAAAALLAGCLALAPPVGPARRGLLDIHMNYSVLPAMRCVAGFLLGMVAWRAGREPAVARVACRPWTGAGVFLVVLGLMCAGADDLLVLALMPLVVVGLHRGRRWPWRLFTLRPVHGLGVLSYAIYLIHYALMPVLLDGPGPVAARLALYAAATLLLAGLAHYRIERPTRRFIRWLGEAMVMPTAHPALVRLARYGAARRGQ